MTISVEFIAAIERCATVTAGDKIIPWPMLGNLGAFISFSTFEEWKKFWFDFSLKRRVPVIVMQNFEQAQKLYLLGWLDFGLVTAGELIALTTLEYALRDRYLDRERHRRRELISAKALKEDRELKKGERFWIERIGFADLLKFMVENDNLTDEKINLVRRAGGSVVKLLTGKREPSLAEMRNVRAHGIPFGSGFEAGLLELVRDLIDYAYRDFP